MQHKAAFALVLLLLVVQVFCDLSLPRYTSDIVDVGIQQGGIEHASPSVLTKETHDDLASLLEGDDRALFEESYRSVSAFDESSSSGKDKESYSLTEKGEDSRVALDDALVSSMVVIDAARKAGFSSLEQPGGRKVAEETLAKTQESSDSSGLLEQQAINAAKDEYSRLGIDVDSLQMTYLLQTGGAMLLVAAASMVVSVLVGLLASRTGTKIGRRLREQLFSKVVSFSDKEIDSFGAASLITRGTNDIQLIQMVSIVIQRMVLYAPIMAIGGIVMVVQSTLSLWWLIALAVVAVLVVVGVLMAVTMPRFRIMQTLIDKVNLVAREQLSGLSVVRAFGRESFEESRFEKSNERLMSTQLFTNRAMSLMMPAMMLVMNATSVLIVWFGAGFVDLGVMQTGDLIALITYSMMIVMSFLMIGMVAIMLPRANVAAARIDAVIATDSSIVDPELGTETKRGPEPEASPDHERVDAPASAKPGARIAFEDVSFSYGDDACVLEGVSFVVEPGQTCAIIGSTGSGKSTVVKLIERFVDVSSGRVTFDGVDVRDMPQSCLRSQIGYVPQASFLFSGSIADNVNYSGNVDPNRTQLALDISQSADFVKEKEEGLNTQVSQGGTNVSGGQRQRLAIARALARDARVYLFDDSFSALDYKTDACLRQGLSERLGDRTVIIVAQRIATIMDADLIVVLDEGRVVGKGTHSQLLSTCDVYREIAQSQLSEEDLERTRLTVSALKGGD